jgi:hypothetical protein
MFSLISNWTILLFCSLVMASITCSYIMTCLKAIPMTAEGPLLSCLAVLQIIHKAHIWINWRSNRWNLKFNLLWSLVFLLSKTWRSDPWSLYPDHPFFKSKC